MTKATGKTPQANNEKAKDKTVAAEQSSDTSRVAVDSAPAKKTAAKKTAAKKAAKKTAAKKTAAKKTAA